MDQNNRPITGNSVYNSRIKGRAIIRARPSTFLDKNLTPVQFSPMFFPKKLSPVLKTPKKYRQNWSPVVLMAFYRGLGNRKHYFSKFPIRRESKILVFPCFSIFRKFFSEFHRKVAILFFPPRSEDREKQQL